MAACLCVGDRENMVDADDSNVWQMGSNVEEVVRKLTEKASLFLDYTRSMGLSINASKTQLLFSANAGNVADVTVEVDGSTIKLQQCCQEHPRCTAARPRDHIPDLLDLAGIVSANRMVVKAVAAEAWMCYHSNNGQDGARNHVGSLLFADNKTATAKKTRLARTGQITAPLRGGDTFITHAANVSNKSGSYATRPRRRQQRRRH
jgi:hypothetical protein